MKLQQTIIIARPVEEVFAYRTALQQVPEWQRDIIATELAPPGTAGVGARGTESRRGLDGAEEEWELEITEFELNRVLGTVSRCGPVQIHELSIFVADEGSTRYTVSVEMTGSPLTASAVQKKTVEALMHLRSRLEMPRSISGAYPRPK